MGGGLFKMLGFVAPVVLAVIFLVWHQQQEHKAEMQVESAQFDRDWNGAMANMTKGRDQAAKQQYLQRAALAQGQYSGGRIGLAEQQRTTAKIGSDIDKSVKSFDEAVSATERGEK